MVIVFEIHVYLEKRYLRSVFFGYPIHTIEDFRNVIDMLTGL